MFIFRIGSKSLATFRAKVLATLVEISKSLTNASKSFIRDMAEAQNVPLVI